MTNNRAKALEALTEWKISRSTGNADLEHEKAKAMSKAVEDALSEPKWKSMDSAPRDGTRVLLWNKLWSQPQAGHSMCAGWAAYWCSDHTGHFKYQPTHWMHLPDAPTGGES